MNQYLVFYSNDKYNSALIFADNLQQVEQFLQGTEFQSINGTIYAFGHALNTVPNSVPQCWQYFADRAKQLEHTEHLSS